MSKGNPKRLSKGERSGSTRRNTNGFIPVSRAGVSESRRTEPRHFDRRWGVESDPTLHSIAHLAIRADELLQWLAEEGFDASMTLDDAMDFIEGEDSALDGTES